MSSVLLIAMAAIVPFIAPLPDALSAAGGPAYLVLFGVALLRAGGALRRPSPSPVQRDKEAWSGTVPQSSATTI